MKRHRNYLFGLAVTLLTLTASFAITAGAAQRGDIDADGVVTPADARLALRCSVGLPKKDDPASVFSEKEKDLADMDMDLRVSAADARAILRTAVRLDPPLPYYAFTVISAPTCTEKGLYERTGPDPENGETEIRFMQEIPPLGHDTRLGTCGRYGAYQSELLDRYLREIEPALRKGETAAEKAYETLYQLYAADFTNNTITIDQAKPLYRTAHEYYLAAYQACGSEREFTEAKQQIGTILGKLSEIYHAGPTAGKDYINVFSRWVILSNELLDDETGDLAALTAITDGYLPPD